MKDFSIDVEAENIFDQRTREYFQEVLGSFVNGNYRSAVVMLWSVVVADLIYKLQELRDIHADPAAVSILASVEQKQQSNPNSPEWEIFLLDQVNEKLELFETADYQHIVNVQKLRHLSAHPVLTATNLLFAPNRETARACIRNALEAVLLKPPIFSKKIVSAIVVDVAAKKALLPDDVSLKQYLEAKYFRSLRLAVEHELIKALWKFCFRVANTETDAHRDVNLRVLKLLHSRRPAEFKQLVNNHVAYFSDIAASGPPLACMVDFLSTCPAIYSALSAAAKVPLSAFVKPDINLLAIAFFLFETKCDLIQLLLSKDYAYLKDMTDSTWERFLALAQECGLIQEAYSVGIRIYVKSINFDNADINFPKFIASQVEEYDKQRLEELLTGIESNDQTYGRGRSRSQHVLISSRAHSLSNIDLRTYPEFSRSVASA